MNVLADTNILTRLAVATDPQHHAAAAAVQTIVARGDAIVIFPQTAYEFWAVSTRPGTSNGLGLTAAETKSHLDRFRSAFPLISDSSDLFTTWERLVTTCDVLGKSSQRRPPGRVNAHSRHDPPAHVQSQTLLPLYLITLLDPHHLPPEP